MHRYGRILKILKIAVGSMLAMAAAQALGLRYSSSAGVITLLSIHCIGRVPAFGNGDFSSDVYPAVHEMGHTGGDIREHGPDDPYSG